MHAPDSRCVLITRCGRKRNPGTSPVNENMTHRTVSDAGWISGGPKISATFVFAWKSHKSCHRRRALFGMFLTCRRARRLYDRCHAFCRRAAIGQCRELASLQIICELFTIVTSPTSICKRDGQQTNERRTRKKNLRICKIDMMVEGVTHLALNIMTFFRTGWMAAIINRTCTSNKWYRWYAIMSRILDFFGTGSELNMSDEFVPYKMFGAIRR